MAASPTDLEGFAETGGSEISSSHEDKIDSLSDSENLTAHIAISSLYNQCIQNLNDLEACSHTHLSELQDLVSRLQIWAGNHGAHRPPNDRLSLDHRLREAPELHREARDHFNEINRALGDAISIASGIALKYLPEDSYSSSSGSDASLTSSQKAFIGVPDSTNEPDGDVKLERLLQNIDAIITSLYKFSITIQNPAHRDRTARATKIDFSFWHDADFRHVRDKFPKCTNQQLLHDLARANTKRRQLFAYHERHKNKIQHFKESSLEEQKYVPKSVPEYRVGYPMSQPSTTKQQTVRTSNTIFTNTTVSTVQQPIASIPKSISGRSQRTNIVHSSFSESEDLLNIAPLPADSKLYTSPFVCPYCFLVTNPRNFKAWEIHVLDDLRPYSCTFGDCASAEILYDRYSEWKSHELEVHRREWFCNFCEAIFEKQDEFLLHLQIQHLELLREVSPTSLASICERISTGNEDCTLCGDFTGDVYALQQHLARHMRQLAMHTLPKLNDDSPDASEAKSSRANAQRDDEMERNTRRELINMPEEISRLLTGGISHNPIITRPSSPQEIPDTDDFISWDFCKPLPTESQDKADENKFQELVNPFSNSTIHQGPTEAEMAPTLGTSSSEGDMSLFRKLEVTRNHAASVYNALEKSWECDCKRHVIAFQLFKSVPGDWSLQFHLLIPVEPVESTTMEGFKASHRLVSNFVSETTTNPVFPKITNGLCSKFRSNRAPFSPLNPSYIADQANNYHSIQPAVGEISIPTNHDVVTLEDRISHKEEPWIERSERYRIGLSLAWALLYLKTTPWFPGRLTKDMILFRRKDLSLFYAELDRRPAPYIMHFFERALVGAAPELRFTTSAREDLEELGIILVELCLGEPIKVQSSRLKAMALSSSNTMNSTLVTARSYISNGAVSREAGSIYENIIKYCLFNSRDSDFDWADPNFCQRFYDNVVIPLEKVLGATFISDES